MKKQILSWLLLAVVFFSCQKRINDNALTTPNAPKIGAGGSKMQEARHFLTRAGFFKFRSESRDKP